MPSRWLSAVIVVWWLAMMGWLLGHDLWPSWRPGEPPRFHIDLVEEVRHSDRLKTYWDVQRWREDEPNPVTFRAMTWADYQPEDDSFTFHARLDAKKAPLKLLGFQVESLISKYRVNRAGQLRDLQFEANFSPPGRGERQFEKLHAEPKPSSIQFVLWGEVRDDQFFAHCRADSSLKTKLGEIDLPPVSMPHNASVILPLHPVNRIHGLRPGQSWRQPLVDPIRDAFNALGGGGIHYINARVLPQPQILNGENDAATTCLVIEYEDEGQVVGRTWVEQDSERVQQQEALFEGDRWTMKRDNPRKAIQRSLGARPSSPDRQPRIEP